MLRTYSTYFFVLLTNVSGLAPSMSIEILGRIVSGIGGAGLQTLVSLIILGMSNVPTKSNSPEMN
jgi:hypothetical protein